MHMYVCMYLSLSIHIHLYIYIYIYICVCIHAYIHAYIHTYIHIEEDASAKDAQKAKHSSSNQGADGPRQASASPVASPTPQMQQPVMVPVAWQGNPALSMMQQPFMMQQVPYAMPYPSPATQHGAQGVAPYASPAAQPLPMVPAFPQGAPCGQAPQYFLAPQGMPGPGQPQQYYMVNAAQQHGQYGMQQQVLLGGGMLQQQPQVQMAPMTQQGMASTVAPNAQQEGAHHYYHQAVPHPLPFPI